MALDPGTVVTIITFTVGAALRAPDIIRGLREIGNSQKQLDRLIARGDRCLLHLEEVKHEVDRLYQHGGTDNGQQRLYPNQGIPEELYLETKKLIRYCQRVVRDMVNYHERYGSQFWFKALHWLSSLKRSPTESHDNRLEECALWTEIAAETLFLRANFDAAVQDPWGHVILRDCRHRAQRLRGDIGKAERYCEDHRRRMERHMEVWVDLGVFRRYWSIANDPLFAPPRAPLSTIAGTPSPRPGHRPRRHHRTRPYHPTEVPAPTASRPELVRREERRRTSGRDPAVSRRGGNLAPQIITVEPPRDHMPSVGRSQRHRRDEPDIILAQPATRDDSHRSRAPSASRVGTHDNPIYSAYQHPTAYVVADPECPEDDMGAYYVAPQEIPHRVDRDEDHSGPRYRPSARRDPSPEHRGREVSASREPRDHHGSSTRRKPIPAAPIRPSRPRADAPVPVESRDRTEYRQSSNHSRYASGGEPEYHDRRDRPRSPERSRSRSRHRTTNSIPTHHSNSDNSNRHPSHSRSTHHTRNEDPRETQPPPQPSGYTHHDHRGRSIPTSSHTAPTTRPPPPPHIQSQSYNHASRSSSVSTTASRNSTIFSAAGNRPASSRATSVSVSASGSGSDYPASRRSSGASQAEQRDIRHREKDGRGDYKQRRAPAEPVLLPPPTTRGRSGRRSYEDGPGSKPYPPNSWDNQTKSRKKLKKMERSRSRSRSGAESKARSRSRSEAAGGGGGFWSRTSTVSRNF
ncbi:hypothetical protein B0T19DRAFT_110858 [Cercophora scortea]|uniref:Uncharacterized protein n=1 Tax=Cercophora scortea TaxID=314031 RepID=A0AAE0IY92_9PEZI|nr:hypothetical protein B0T19DRAFT_110858 [Cercophora scortea]